MAALLFDANVARGLGDDPSILGSAGRPVASDPERLPTTVGQQIDGDAGSRRVAIAGQRHALFEVGLELLNRLARTYGIASPDGSAHAFPHPKALASARIDSLKRLGFSRAKSLAMIELARGVASGRLDLERVTGLDDDAAVAALCALRGVGRWTAEYVLLRGVGRLQIFPGDDVGAQKALGRWLGRTSLSGYDVVERALAPWRPWAGLIYFHLLLTGLAEAGDLA